MALTPKQRAQLKKLAHPLKPIHQVGKEGLSDATLGAILDALNHRELMKVRVQDTAPTTARETGEAIAARFPEVEHVQTIGKTVVLYRRHPEKPVISLVR
ncbi:MAG: ribosome assembly RNA-binding protein YhbY [Gemmatimonadota bacterium]|jgi:RNA-binding protein|nr:ribosome assembly RNA-binding protein YhbY [Gemmatimonadota bacterium]